MSKWCAHKSHDVESGFCVRCHTAEREFAITLSCPYVSAVGPTHPQPQPEGAREALEQAARIANELKDAIREGPTGVTPDLLQEAADTLRALAAVPPQPAVSQPALSDAEVAKILESFTPEDFAALSQPVQCPHCGWWVRTAVPPQFTSDDYRTAAVAIQATWGDQHGALAEKFRAASKGLGTHERESAVRDEVGSVPDVPANSAAAPAKDTWETDPDLDSSCGE